MEVLLADDERAVRAGLKRMLSAAGYAVRAVADGAAAVAECKARRPDLLLLDVAMPKLDGLGACRAVRQFDASVPILFLTAYAESSDELRGLAAGADDFIDKASLPEIVLARIEAALRRASVGVAQDDSSVSFVFGGGTVDPDALVFRADGRQVDLSLREVELLRLFAEHPGAVFSRDALQTRFWGLSFEGTENALTMQIKRLREKLGPDGLRLVAVRGAGYRYEPIGVHARSRF